MINKINNKDLDSVIWTGDFFSSEVKNALEIIMESVTQPWNVVVSRGKCMVTGWKLNFEWKDYSEPILTSTLYKFDWNRCFFIENSYSWVNNSKVFINSDQKSFNIHVGWAKKRTVIILNIPVKYVTVFVYQYVEYIVDHPERFPYNSCSLEYSTLRQMYKEDEES